MVQLKYDFNRTAAGTTARKGLPEPVRTRPMTKAAELVFFPSWTAGRKGYADRIREIFRAHHHEKGLRLTPQRQAILDLLLEAERHLGQEEIYRVLKPRGIGKVTVFRTLKLLLECGLADRVEQANGSPRYEIGRERPHHDHLVCVDCGAVKEIQWPEVERIQEKTCRQLGFIPLWHRHELFGRCAGCAAKPK